MLAFAREHQNEEPLKLLLQQGRYPGVDMKLVAQQIEGMRQASTKWPTLAACEQVIYPAKLNREQSSSEATARVKEEILKGRFGDGQIGNSNSRTEMERVADLTGGMGIDSMALARVAKHVDYVERDAELCRIMEHNCKVLGIKNISVHCDDNIEWLSKCDKHFEMIFVDPARRDNHGRKVAAFEDCVPNIIEHQRMIEDRCEWLMVKASPMMDIDMGIAQLGRVKEVHVVAVKGECKEVVFVCKMGGMSLLGGNDERAAGDEALIYAHNVLAGGIDCRHAGFRRSEEEKALGYYCQHVRHYIYEPDAALMKSGPYKLLCQKGRLEKLDRNTHLYTSDEMMEWSGRVFRVVGEAALNKKNIARMIPERKAHVVVRNYPSEAAELQKRLGLKEGGELFVVATTVKGEKKWFVCEALRAGFYSQKGGENEGEI